MFAAGNGPLVLDVPTRNGRNRIEAIEQGSGAGAQPVAAKDVADADARHIGGETADALT